MRIQINHTVRDMTEEEIDALDTGKDRESATAEDYENALTEMGVDFND